MTSFGTTKLVRENFLPTFKIQGQIYHKAGSLLPVSDSDYKFLQIYFMGNSSQEINLRCAHNNLVKRSIVAQLQNLFHEHNQLVKLFKSAIDMMPSDDHKNVIRADKTPVGQHAGRFNAPTIDEVAIIVVGENLESRDIVLHRRNNKLQRIKETHRSYDALQYPILCHKYVVDMYVKIETERLTFIRLNQTKFRSEEYIHLRDAINSDGNAENVGRMTILPATYIGSPRHMHEYAQDAMSYVRQSPIYRHDIIARVFRQKLKSLMDFIVKHCVFGETRCWMYSVECTEECMI
ncbi:uncharacterized protein LOC128921444 [Zeugodacus cucurbitae]|uniref:uncharacterized protein LOC128921444 n=1 Tax=Zeugodacus cucurbitae TaxID=28588 RepID=UPI0023D96244|nr:uncharacterized protein LOC128921444 [Zeugodacus cucurbitae]